MISDKQKTELAKNAENAESMLKLLANKFRLQILCSLSEGEKSVSELSSNLNLSQSSLSQHLAKLREEGMVATNKRGKMVYYKIQSIEVNAILSVLYLIYCNN